MKTIENKEINFADDVKDYATLIKFCMNRTPQGGYTVEEMRKRLRVLDVIEKAGKEINLEDADFECAKTCVKGMKWGTMHQEIVDFVDYINSVEDKKTIEEKVVADVENKKAKKEG